MKRKHYTCKPGAAVRLHGYMPAKVMGIERDEDGVVWARCIVTVRRSGIGPHGYGPGQMVWVRSSQAVPRDCIRVARGSGRLYWPVFAVEDKP